MPPVFIFYLATTGDRAVGDTQAPNTAALTLSDEAGTIRKGPPEARRG
jgi:hypothetical protein